jgi:hypothetical protein
LLLKIKISNTKTCWSKKKKLIVEHRKKEDETHTSSKPFSTFINFTPDSISKRVWVLKIVKILKE